MLRNRCLYSTCRILQGSFSWMFTLKEEFISVKCYAFYELRDIVENSAPAGQCGSEIYHWFFRKEVKGLGKYLALSSDKMICVKSSTCPRYGINRPIYKELKHMTLHNLWCRPIYISLTSNSLCKKERKRIFLFGYCIIFIY